MIDSASAAAQRWDSDVPATAAVVVARNSRRLWGFMRGLLLRQRSERTGKMRGGTAHAVLDNLAVVGIVPHIAQDEQPWRRWLRWLARGTLVGLLLLLLLIPLENFGGRRAWKQFEAEANARGEWLDSAAIIPLPVPDAENFAAIPLFKPLFDWTNGQVDSHSGLYSTVWRDPEGRDRLDAIHVHGNSIGPMRESARWREGRSVDLAAWQAHFRSQTNQFPAAPQPQTPAADVLLALSKFNVEMGQLHAAMSRPHARFPIRYENHLAALLHHPTVLIKFTDIAELRALAALSENRVEAAKDDLLLGLRLAAALDGEPLLISKLVTLRLIETLMPVLWEGLTRHQWGETQLATIEDALGKFDFVVGFQRAIRGERSISTFGAMEALRKYPDLFNDLVKLMDSDDDNIIMGVLWRLMPSGWLDYNKAYLGQLYQRLLETADPAAHRFYLDKADALQEEANADGSPSLRNLNRMMAPMVFPRFGSLPGRCARAQTTLDLARVAIALERHRIKHGALPETLDALAPVFLASVPRDVISGAPLKYQRGDASRFALYAVGWNGTDDGGQHARMKGGTPPQIDWRAGDWPWPQPATKE